MATTATAAGRLATLGGCGRFAEVVEGPADRAELERAVASGAVRRVHRGCYCLPGTSAAVVAATVFRAVVTCVSAADLYGLTVLDPPDRVHLSVPRRRGTSRPGLRDQDAVVLHREASSPQPHPHPHPQLQPSMVRVAPPASALARVLQCQPGDLAVVTVDSAVNRRLVTVDELRAALPPGAVRARLVLGLVDGRSQSPSETLARLALRRDGLRVEPQVRIPGVGRVDLLVERCVVVEADGFGYHAGRSQFREDRRRDRELAKQGRIVLRFSFEDIVRDPGRLVADVRAVLARTGRHPRSAPRV
jgi:very-short-patch-repair endonuclease